MFKSPSGRRVPVEIHTVAMREGDRVVGIFGLAEVDAPLPPMRRDSLTPRQLEVLGHLSNGCSTDQIAKRLHLSPETVRNHVRGVLRSLGVHSRLEAVVEGRRRGLIG
ncbi:MAG: response regulator transcription factor [Actinobacteria bacterium]|nr:response regulator transcription factor [Actinomycetota bacterium]